MRVVTIIQSLMLHRIRKMLGTAAAIMHHITQLDFDKIMCMLQCQQWVRIVIIGQSFMLHQIRKMVGMAVAIMRGDAPPSCLKLALQPKRQVPTPMAPEIGLFLDECYYDAYNTR